MADEPAWDVETDLLVVGSGAAGLTAALVAAAQGVKALVVEKSELYGGTSATSGGVIWIAATEQALSAGHADSPEEAFEYVRALSDANVPDERIWAFVRRGREMVAWLTAHTDVKVRAHPYADYHPEMPGGKLGWRSHEVLPLHASELGADFERLRPPHPAVQFLGKVSWTLEETGGLLFRGPGWWWIALRLFGDYLLDFPLRFYSLRDRRLTLGNALIARLKLSLNRAGGELWLNSPLVELITADQRIVGALVLRDGNRVRIRARRGLVLAAGGFERSAPMREQYLPLSHNPLWSGSQINNTGDGIVAAMRVGAGTLNMDSAWWGTSLSLPGEDRARLLAFERALPGAIIVNQSGKRYMNEAASYHIAGQEMIRQHSPQASTIPSYLLFDAKWRERYPLGPMIPDLPDWMQPANLQAVLIRAEGWDELARKMQLSGETLKATIARFNEHARAGNDPDFHRGESAYDRYYGDPKVQPNPTLRALETPPFYAVPIYPGDIGTNGGVATNEYAQVLDKEGRPIPGLYAAGNMAATVMGHSYPAAGATLGPGMTFGYIAALHALSERAAD
ncbi:MAG TPA: FAD-dependent oxidoreductase [Steroidobacteraceae bacterium]|nr:FAD-dependent oxidoreductase [Steroidobacteraceae bacterium]